MPVLCPVCNQPISKIPPEFQCNLLGCEEFGDYEAWFRNGTLLQKLVVCADHLKQSIGYQSLISEGKTHEEIMAFMNEDYELEEDFSI